MSDAETNKDHDDFHWHDSMEKFFSDSDTDGIFKGK